MWRITLVAPSGRTYVERVFSSRRIDHLYRTANVLTVERV